MPLPKRNPKLPDLEEMSQGEINIRETERWKKLYMRLIDSKNDDEDPEIQRLIAEARAKRIEREIAEGLR